jgi:hypothetical protein
MGWKQGDAMVSSKPVLFIDISIYRLQIQAKENNPT